MEDVAPGSRRPVLARYGRKRGPSARSRSLEPDNLSVPSLLGNDEHPAKRPRLLADLPELSVEASRSPKSILKRPKATSHGGPILGDKSNLPTRSRKAASAEPTPAQNASSFLPAAFLTRVRPTAALRVFVDPTSAAGSPVKKRPLSPSEIVASPAVAAKHALPKRHVLESTPVRPGLRTLPDLDVSLIPFVPDDSMDGVQQSDTRVWLDDDGEMMDGVVASATRAVSPQVPPMADKLDRGLVSQDQVVEPSLIEAKPVPDPEPLPRNGRPVPPEGNETETKASAEKSSGTGPANGISAPSVADLESPSPASVRATCQSAPGGNRVDSPSFALPDEAPVATAADPLDAQGDDGADDQVSSSETEIAEAAPPKPTERRISLVRFQSPLAEVRSLTPMLSSDTEDDKEEDAAGARAGSSSPAQAKPPTPPRQISQGAVDTLRARFAISSIAPRSLFSVANPRSLGTIEDEPPLAKTNVKPTGQHPRDAVHSRATSRDTPATATASQRRKANAKAKVVPLTRSFPAARPAARAEKATATYVRGTRILEKAPSGASDSSEDPLAIGPGWQPA